MSSFRRSLLAVALLLGFAVPAHAQRGPVAAALLQFEEALTWEAMTPDWRRLRPGWVQQVSNAASPAQTAALMVQLETNMGWEAVQGSWRGRRDTWLAEAQRARSPADVAALLKELEEVTLWSAVSGSWRGTRPGWVARLDAIASGRGATGK